MFNKILVCLDGSGLAEQIIPFAVEQARKFGSELVLFRTVPETAAISPAIPGMPGLPLETRGSTKQLIEDEEEAETYLKYEAEKIQAEERVPVSYGKTVGSAGRAIVEYCKKNDIELIAIATHGRSGLGRVLLGSVADYVIRHTDIPIMLIRPSGEKAK